MHEISRESKEGAKVRSGSLAGRADASANSGTILVVDDDRDAADTTAAQLEAIGLTVIADYSADDGLDRLDERPDICLVVSHVRMPGLDRFDFIRVVRHRFPSLPALLTTALPITDDDAVPRGVLILQRPFAIDELKRAIAGLLGTSPNACQASPE
jgi:two-component system NtrC family sensor kinase